MREIEEELDEREGPTGFDLVPDDRRGKLLCMICAKLTGTPFETLYRKTPRGRVLEQLALAVASQYSSKGRQ